MEIKTIFKSSYQYRSDFQICVLTYYERNVLSTSCEWSLAMGKVYLFPPCTDMRNRYEKIFTDKRHEDDNFMITSPNIYY